MKNIIIGVAVVALGAIIVLAGAGGGTQTDRIVIGAPLSLTGAAATDALNIKRGLELARADLVDRGIDVEIIYEDDATIPARTIGAVQKLITINNVDVVVGPTWSFLASAAAPVFEEYEIVSLQPADTSEFVEGNAYTFFGATKNAEKTEPVAEWIKENGFKKVAIVVDVVGWGLSNQEAFERAAEIAGADVVLVEHVPFGGETIPSVITKIIATDADVVLTTGFEQEITILINKLQNEVSGVPVAVATDIVEALIKRGDVVVSEGFELYTITNVPSEAFSKKFEEVYGELPGNYADRAYDNLMILVDAIQNKNDDESVADYLRNKTNYDGYATTYSFDENGDIEGGEWVIKKL